MKLAEMFTMPRRVRNVSKRPGASAISRRGCANISRGSPHEIRPEEPPNLTPARVISRGKGQQFEYAFDDIGNRTGTKAGGDENGWNLRTAGYTANNLNQYTARDIPAAVDIMGIALATKAVTVNNQTAYRKGEYCRKQLTVTNDSAPVWLSVTNAATGETTVIGNIFVPTNREVFTYDVDGNLTNDGRWTYTWDAENRVVVMEAISSVPDAAKFKLAFDYDYRGRRIKKKVSTYSGSTYVAQSTNRFVYDGWNLLANLNPELSALSTFLWGLDLSGSLQGAGGVGGLIALNDASQGVHFAAFDGNGNVSALVKAVNGTVSARYEYGPFGELLRSTGPVAKANPLRFSTKYQDDESDFSYYGYRSYNPSTGRWISRDPLGERGGQNLYALVSNAVVDDYDLLGLLHSGQIFHINTGTDSSCTARVVYYSPVPIFAYGKRTIDTQVGAQLRIEISCDCSDCDGCYKWRQHYVQYEDGKRTRDNVLDAPKGEEWYPESRESPGAGCCYAFKDSPIQYPPPEMFLKSVPPVYRVVVSFRLELVKLANCRASSGGTPVANIRWGFWYTKDANGLLNWDPTSNE